MTNLIADKVTKDIFQIIDKIANLGFEQRESQEDIMINIIDNAYRERKNLLIEAGVGIGKSLSYLLPGILLSKYTKKPLVVATSSIQLTEQLSQDIDTASKILGLEVDKVVGKGQKNYPCVQRISKLYEKTKNEEYTKMLGSIKEGVDKQNPADLDLKYWNDICVDNCTFSSCRFHSECYFYKVRNELRKDVRQKNYFVDPIPKVIIVNQDLLISHLFKLNRVGKGIIYKDPCLLIIDEIHNIEEKTRNALTKEINFDYISKLFRDYSNLIMQTSESKNAIDEGKKCLKKVEGIFATISTNLIKETNKHTYDGDFDRLFVKSGSKILCNEIIISINDILDYIDIAISIKSNDRLNILSDSIYERFKEVIVFFNSYCENNIDNLLWGKIIGKSRRATISYCPKRIDQKLNQLIFSPRYPTIGLSATITVRNGEEDSYDYIVNNIGFSGITDDVHYSPFPYENSRIFIPDDLPKYNERDETYFKKISNLIRKIVLKNTGGNLVLFTAKNDLLEVNKLLEKELDIPIYVDGGEKSQKIILQEFKEKGGIILGTGVFWEGIDLKGDYLTNLVIVRLPFPVPDPIIDYKINKIGDSDKVLIPEMITRLKQGSGRLIRTMEDKGILTILDSRMLSDRYKHKKLILDSIPFKKQLYNWDDFNDFQEKK